MKEETEVVVVLPPNVLDGTETRSGKQQPYDVPFNQAMLGNAWSELDLGEHKRYVAEKLYQLSEKLGRINPDDQAHGCLGGEWGYGQDFKNDVFEMHPYYWGDCDCGAEKSWVEKDTHEFTCSTVRPNFRYQDIEIRWYKYIGREMTISREVTRQELIAMFRKCFASVAKK